MNSATSVDYAAIVLSLVSTSVDYAAIVQPLVKLVSTMRLRTATIVSTMLL